MGKNMSFILMMLHLALQKQEKAQLIPMALKVGVAAVEAEVQIRPLILKFFAHRYNNNFIENR